MDLVGQQLPFFNKIWADLSTLQYGSGAFRTLRIMKDNINAHKIYFGYHRWQFNMLHRLRIWRQVILKTIKCAKCIKDGFGLSTVHFPFFNKIWDYLSTLEYGSGAFRILRIMEDNVSTHKIYLGYHRWQ